MKKTPQPTESPPLPSASTMEGMENECIALSYELAKKRLVEGTATSAEIVHFLKLGSMKEQLDEELIRKDMALKDAKIESLQTNKQIEEMFSEAMRYMSRYQGYFDDGQ